jgi:tetratricopeptide (TPR) repeat protein
VSGPSPGTRPGHAFLCYVREDREQAARLHRELTASGIGVWRDTSALWAGQDWRQEIRRAITRDSLAFIACFSASADRRETSYQNEELILATEQMRLRRPGQSWLIPVRLSPCEIPAYDLGAGRSLDSLQAIDLFGAGQEAGTARLISAVLQILGEGDIAERQLRRAATLRAQARPAAAQAAVREAMRVDPGLDAAAEGSCREAIRLARQGAGGEAAQARAYHRLSLVLGGQGRVTEAEAALREAIRLAPGDPVRLNDLASVLHEQGRYAQAEAAAREATRLDPAFRDAYLGLGDHLARQRRPREAALAYGEAIRLDPADAEAHQRLQDLTAGAARPASPREARPPL